MSRLVTASQGTLDAMRTGFVAAPQSTNWSLDALGNWSAGASNDSVRTFLDSVAPIGQFDAGDAIISTEHHETNPRNEIVSRTGGGGTEAYFYDAAGNLLLDDERYYRYDFWNRLIAVYEKGTVSIDTINGVLIGTPGTLLTQFSYDALGRKVTTFSSAEGTTRHVYGSGANVLAEYDGGSGDLERAFIWGRSFPDPLVLVDFTGAGGGTAGTAQLFYYLKDVLGSVGVLINPAKNKVGN